MRCPYGHRTGPALDLQCFSYPTGPVRDPQGCRAVPLLTRKEIYPTIIGKNPARASFLSVWAPYSPCTSRLQQSLNPYGARKLIMHALKLYGTRTGRENSYGAARRGRTIFVQTARTGPGSVMYSSTHVKTVIDCNWCFHDFKCSHTPKIAQPFRPRQNGCRFRKRKSGVF